MKPQSLLLRGENVPHFINFSTRARCLALYRNIHRNILKVPLPFVQRQLKLLAQHGFARFKFVASKSKTEALLDYVETHEALWAIGAANGKHKDLYRVMELAFNTYKVKETGMKQVLLGYRNACDHKDINYRLNNIPTPPERTFEEHFAKEKQVVSETLLKIKSPYWQLVKFSKGNQKNTARSLKRKLHFKLEETRRPLFTVLGKPLPLSRQKNILRKFYNKFLEDAPRPVHPDAIRYIQKHMRDKSLDRLYRRRLREFAEILFSINPDGTLLKAEVPI